MCRKPSRSSGVSSTGTVAPGGIVNGLGCDRLNMSWNTCDVMERMIL